MFSMRTYLFIYSHIFTAPCLYVFGGFMKVWRPKSYTLFCLSVVMLLLSLIGLLPRVGATQTYCLLGD